LRRCHHLTPQALFACAEGSAEDQLMAVRTSLLLALLPPDLPSSWRPRRETGLESNFVDDAYNVGYLRRRLLDPLRCINGLRHH
jgi:hypothetical protein